MPPRNGSAAPRGADDRAIAAFWAWFGSIADELAADFGEERIHRDFTSRLAALGGLRWELGPGVAASCRLAISPDGDRGRLPAADRVVAMAPAVPEWEFVAGRPPRDAALELQLHTSAGAPLDVDARSWRYVLSRYPDGAFDIAIEQVGSVGLGDELAHAAAVLVLDALLGERRVLLEVNAIEVVSTFAAERARRASPIATLVAHLDSLSA
jgi:hypothetical protein